MNISYKVFNLNDAKLERLGAIKRHVFFTPSITGNKYLKFAYVEMDSGTISPPHLHIGEEAIYTLQGVGSCELNGRIYKLEKDTAFIIPPGKPHQIRVVSSEPWIGICAYCDECSVLQKYIMEMEIDLQNCLNSESSIMEDLENKNELTKLLIEEGIKKMQRCPVNLVDMARHSMKVKIYCEKCGALEHTYQFLNFQSSYIEGGCHGPEQFKVLYKKNSHVVDLTLEALKIFT